MVVVEWMAGCIHFRQGVQDTVCGRRIICDHFSTCARGFLISGAEAARCRSWLAQDTCWVEADIEYQRLYRRELEEAGFFRSKIP